MRRKNKGIIYFLGSLLLISVYLGVHKNNKNQVKNNTLETKIKTDSVFYHKTLQDTTIFYSNKLTNFSQLYKKSLLKNTNLNKKNKSLSSQLKESINLEDKRFQEKIKKLKEKHEYSLNNLKNSDSIKYAILKNNYINSESGKNEFKNLYQKEKLKNKKFAQNTNPLSKNKSEKEISFDVRNKNSLYDFWFNVPRFKAVRHKYLIFEDDHPEFIEGWAFFNKTGRGPIPLEKSGYSTRHGIFAFPDFSGYEGPFDVWANDKGKEEIYKKKTLYVWGNIVYTKKSLVPKNKLNRKIKKQI